MTDQIEKLGNVQIRYIAEQWRVHRQQDQQKLYPDVKTKSSNINYDVIRVAFELYSKEGDEQEKQLKDWIRESEEITSTHHIVALDPVLGTVLITGMVLLYKYFDKRLDYLYEGKLIKDPGLDNLPEQLPTLDQQWGAGNTNLSIAEQADVVILTPIEDEFIAAAAHMPLGQYIMRPDTGTNYFLDRFKGKYHTYTIVLSLSQSGLSETSAAVTEAIAAWSPKLVLLVGIAGRVKDAKLGDVVIGTKGYNYEGGKEKGGNFNARPKVVNYSYRWLEQARIIARDKVWLNRVKHQTAPPTNYNPQETVVHFGPIASGEKLVAGQEESTVQKIKQHYNDTLALEMEAVALSIADRYETVQTMNIRSISDELTGKKAAEKAGFKRLAAENASAFAFELLFNYPFKRNTESTREKPMKTKTRNIQAGTYIEIQGDQNNHYHGNKQSPPFKERTISLADAIRQAQTLLKRNNIQGAIDTLYKVTEGRFSEEFDTLVHLEQRLNSLRQKVRNKTLTWDQEETNMSQIVQALLRVINTLQVP